MTQEELAEAAGVSPRAVSDLERAVNLTARRDTARLLADALTLTGSARSEFELAARGRPSMALAAVKSVTAAAVATRTLPRDVASFTGRDSELERLTKAVIDSSQTGNAISIHAIGGMAGVGKTAFAIHAAHHLAHFFPDGQIFLPLHGHTPGQGPVDPAEALASLLQTAGVAFDQIPQGLDGRGRLWRDYLADKRLLIVLDDAANHEQVRPLLPGIPGSVVLITSRRHLTALEDTQAVSLDALPPADAAELLIRLSGRPGLSASDPAIAEIARLCGYLPLAVGLLARQLHHHPAWTAADLVADLTAARDRLELMRAENLSVGAAFDLSYRDLSFSQQLIFRGLGSHPGTDFDAYSVAALAGTTAGAARRALEDLYDQYLVSELTRGRYWMHDLIREHATALASRDPAVDREAAIDRLLDYYLHAAQLAGSHIPQRFGSSNLVTTAPPVELPALTCNVEAVSWFEAERLNLNAVVDYAAGYRRLSHAADIPPAMQGFLRGNGYWDQAISLQRTAADAAAENGDSRRHAAALTDLGDILHLMGDYESAIIHLSQAVQVEREAADDAGEARALIALSNVQRINDFQAALATAQRAVALCHEHDNDLEASALIELAAVQRTAHDYGNAANSLTRALELCRHIHNPWSKAAALDRLADLQRAAKDYPSALTSFSEALSAWNAMGNRHGAAMAIDGIGSIHQMTGNYEAAETLHKQALEIYREIGSRRGQSRSLAYLAAVRKSAGDYVAAAAHLTQALDLARDLSDRVSEAMLLNNLGDLAQQSSGPQSFGPQRAIKYYREALSTAVRYSASAQQAAALAGIGRCQLREGKTRLAADSLSKAIAIYDVIGSPQADELRKTLP